MRIILGSRSEGRKKVLEKMGYSFDVIPADIDEKAIRHENPTILTLSLARAKTDALTARLEPQKALLIVSDQVVVCNGKIYEKPVNSAEVLSFFKSYRDYPAETVTSVMITNLETGTSGWEVDRAKIWFKPIPISNVWLYINSGDPFKHAGGFDHEHPILSYYVDRIEGEPESITGLPVKVTQSMLEVFLKYNTDTGELK